MRRRESERGGHLVPEIRRFALAFSGSLDGSKPLTLALPKRIHDPVNQLIFHRKETTVVPIVTHTDAMNQESGFDDLMARATEGDAEAQFKIGEFYRSHGGRFMGKAAEWFRKAAEQNHARAQLALGLLYLEWLPDHDYREKAQYWIERAVDRGCEAAVKVLVELGPKVDYMDGYDLLVAVECGDPEAQHELGCRLLFGVDGPKDEAAALSLILKAAIGGHPQAQMQMGAHYLFGIYGMADSGEAIKWLSLSAKQNEPYALYYLGYCFHEGVGAIRNDEQAATFLLRSAQMGNSDAQFQLGRFYYEGVVFPENHEQAQSWFRAAALQGHEGAAHLLDWLNTYL